MKRVGIKEFRRNLREHLRAMPVGLTNRGDLVAILVKPEFLNYLIEHLDDGGATPAPDPGGTAEVPTGELAEVHD